MMMNKVKSRVLILMLVMALTVTGMAMPATAYGAEDTDTQATEELAAPAEETAEEEATEEEAAADTAEQTPADEVTEEEEIEPVDTEDVQAEETEVVEEIPAEPELIDPDACGLKAVPASFSSVKLTWTAVDGVDAYKVFVSKDAKTWDEYETVNRNSCTIRNLPTRRTRYFKVVSVAGNASDDYQTASSDAEY